MPIDLVIIGMIFGRYILPRYVGLEALDDL